VISTNSREGVTSLTKIVASPNTSIRRYSPESVRFFGCEAGHYPRYPGRRSGPCARPEERRRHADRRGSSGVGAFRTIGGTVISVDAANNEIKVKDLETKAPVTIKVNADTNLRKLPPMMANMLARRLNPTSRRALEAPEPVGLALAVMVQDSGPEPVHRKAPRVVLCGGREPMAPRPRAVARRRAFVTPPSVADPARLAEAEWETVQNGWRRSEYGSGSGSCAGIYPRRITARRAAYPLDHRASRRAHRQCHYRIVRRGADTSRGAGWIDESRELEHRDEHARAIDSGEVFGFAADLQKSKSIGIL